MTEPQGVPGIPERKHEREMLEVIDQRDRAEEALSQAYYLVIGRSPEWSNLFGHEEALEDINNAQKCLRAAVPTETCRGFRRICTKCNKPIDWQEERGFYHLDDGAPLCDEGHADLESQK